MQVITIHHPIDQNLKNNEGIVLALGFFDGVHRGHQAVIKAARKEAFKRKLPLAVMTFNISPLIVNQDLHPNQMKYLTQNQEKMLLLETFGVDRVYLVDYTSAFSNQSPKAFVDNYLVGLNAKVVVAGFDYTYGAKAIANMKNLPDYAEDRFKIIEVPVLNENNNKIASKQIRKELTEGSLEEANQALGYPYFFRGLVINGFKRGRTLGFPTANIYTQASTLIPKVGVYLVQCQINHQLFWGMASIGYNVTFGDDNDKTIEINLFDFESEIYGEEMLVLWYEYLRGEKKFSSVEAMVEQLNQDKSDCLSRLQKYENYQN